MALLPYANLPEVRRAIRCRRRLRFIYRKSRIVAEPHLLGHYRKTHAYVLSAWRMEPSEGWTYFRFAEMRDVEVLLESFSRIRDGFNPYDPKIDGIDTLIQSGC